MTNYQKGSNYYSFWSEDYYNEVVGSRSSYENLSDDCFEEMLVHKLFKKNKNK